MKAVAGCYNKNAASNPVPDVASGSEDSAADNTDQPMETLEEMRAKENGKISNLALCHRLLTSREPTYTDTPIDKKQGDLEGARRRFFPFGDRIKSDNEPFIVRIVKKLI